MSTAVNPSFQALIWSTRNGSESNNKLDGRRSSVVVSLRDLSAKCTRGQFRRDANGRLTSHTMEMAMLVDWSEDTNHGDDCIYRTWEKIKCKKSWLEFSLFLQCSLFYCLLLNCMFTWYNLKRNRRTILLTILLEKWIFSFLWRICYNYENIRLF